jgi:hypothetical protein
VKVFHEHKVAHACTALLRIYHNVFHKLALTLSSYYMHTVTLSSHKQVTCWQSLSWYQKSKILYMLEVVMMHGPPLLLLACL